MKKVGLILLVFILTAIPVLAIGGAGQVGQDEVAAVVNGDEISVADVDQSINLNGLMNNLMQVDQTLVQLIFTTEAGQELLNEYRKQALEGIIMERLLVQEAENQDISISDEEKDEFFDEQIENIMTQNQMSEEDLLNALQQQGIESLEMFKEVFMDENEQMMLINELQSGVIESVDVSDDEIQEYYDDNNEEFNREEEIEASHILVETEEEAEEVLAQLNEGADFAEMASEYSIDGSAQQGGNLGRFAKGRMVAEFEDAAFDLEKGELSDIIETEFGYHIIKVTNKYEAGEISFEDAKEDIENNLYQQKEMDKFNEYLEELEENADIEILL